MSLGSIETILHDHLHMSKVLARWVPRLLTPNQKEQRADSCKELIKFESKDTQFFYRIVTKGSPFWSWNEIIINAMENALLSYTKEGKGGTFVWKGYAVLLLGQRWHYHDRLIRTGPYNHWKLLFSFVDKIVIYFGQEKAWEAAKRNSFASWQCSSAQINDGSSHIDAVWFQNSPSSAVFTRSSTIWLFPFPKSEKTSEGTAFP